MTTLAEYSDYDPHKAPEPMQQHRENQTPAPARRVTMTRADAAAYLEREAEWDGDVVEMLFRADVVGRHRVVFGGPIKLGESLVIDLLET